MLKMLKMLKNLAGQIAQNEGNVTSCKKVENNFAGARGTRLRVGAFFFRAFARARARRGVAIESAWALASSMGARELSRAFARARNGARLRGRETARAQILLGCLRNTSRPKPVSAALLACCDRRGGLCFVSYCGRP